MKKVLLTLAVFVAFGSMAFAQLSGSATASTNMTVNRLAGLTIVWQGDNPINLGGLLPGTSHNIPALPGTQRFYVTGASGYDVTPPGSPAPIGANVDWAFPGASVTTTGTYTDKLEWWMTDFYLRGEMTYNSDAGVNDRESLAPDGIAAVNFQPQYIQANPTFTATGPVTIPLTCTVSYDPGQ